LGDLSVKAKYWMDRVPKRGNYKYSLSVISGDYSTLSTTSETRVYSRLVGTYKGTYRWDCGLSDHLGLTNDDGSKLLTTDSGSTPATLVVDSEERGIALGHIDFGLSPGSEVMTRSGRHLIVNEFNAYLKDGVGAQIHQISLLGHSVLHDNSSTV
jgi:hypothetical protein